MFKTMKIRLTLVILFILLLVFTIQISANYMFAEKYYIHRKKVSIQAAYDTISVSANESNKNIVEIMSTYEDSNNLQFILANKDLECIYNSKQYSFKQDKSKYRIKSNFNFNKNIELFSLNAKPIIKEKSNNSDNLILYGIIERGSNDYYIVIRTPILSIKEDMYNTNIFILYVSGFALILGASLVYFFAKKTVKPIEEISLMALNVANLDFSIRVPNRLTDDEIGTLSNNINIMAEKLESTILKLKTANEELEIDNEHKTKVDDLRKEFVANVSHELKTPLAILNGYAQMLKEDITGIDKQYYYDVIIDEINNMTLLVNHLLEISLMEDGLDNIDFDVVNITELVSNVLYNYDILFSKKGLEYLFISDEHFYISGNKLYLERVISNFLTNAIRHTKEGNSIVVSIKREQKDIIITVLNEGTHIPSREINRIWDCFYRSDKARTRDENNNIGIGLYFVKKIIIAHNGRFGVRNVDSTKVSTNNNKCNTGVEFWFSLKEL